MTTTILVELRAQSVMRLPLATCGALMILAASAAGAATPSCVAPPVQAETMNVLVQEYQKKADRQEPIAALVTKQVAARWPQGGPDSADLKLLVASLLAKSASGADFNAGLSQELEILCSVFTGSTATADAGSAVAAAAEKKAQPMQPAEKQATAATQEEKAGEGKDKPKDKPEDEPKKPVAEQPTDELDTVEDTLDAKVTFADANIKGKAKGYADVPLDKLLSFHSDIFRCEPTPVGTQLPKSEEKQGSNEPLKDGAKQDPNEPPPKDDYSDGCNHQNAVKSELCISTWRKTADCSRSVFDEIDRRNNELTRLHDEAKTLKADAEQTQYLAALQRKYANETKHALSMENVRGGGFYGFYAGPSFLLQDGGEWKAGTEIYANFVTGAFDRDSIVCPGSWMCRAYYDASFVTPDAFPSEVEDDSTSPISVFDSKGRLRIRGGVQYHWNDWLGAEVGFGLTSPISDRSTSVRAEPRAHIGAHFQTAFPDLAVGEVFLGYARDKSWERLVDDDGDLTTTEDQRFEQRYDRLILDGTLIFPRATLGVFSPGVRLSADVPWSGDTQSEIRVSILLYYPFNKEVEKYRPKVKQAEATE